MVFVIKVATALASVILMAEIKSVPAYFCVGGWVRDKLLGVSGKEDIDIALDNMAGNDFAIALNKWQINKGTGVGY